MSGPSMSVAPGPIVPCFSVPATTVPTPGTLQFPASETLSARWHHNWCSCRQQRGVRTCPERATGSCHQVTAKRQGCVHPSSCKDNQALASGKAPEGLVDQELDGLAGALVPGLALRQQAVEQAYQLQPLACKSSSNFNLSVQSRKFAADHIVSITISLPNLQTAVANFGCPARRSGPALQKLNSAKNLKQEGVAHR